MPSDAVVRTSSDFHAYYDAVEAELSRELVRWIRIYVRKYVELMDAAAMPLDPDGLVGELIADTLELRRLWNPGVGTLQAHLAAQARRRLGQLSRVRTG